MDLYETLRFIAWGLTDYCRQDYAERFVDFHAKRFAGKPCGEDDLAPAVQDLLVACPDSTRAQLLALWGSDRFTPPALLKLLRLAAMAQADVPLVVRRPPKRVEGRLLALFVSFAVRSGGLGPLELGATPHWRGIPEPRQVAEARWLAESLEARRRVLPPLAVQHLFDRFMAYRTTTQPGNKNEFMIVLRMLESELRHDPAVAPLFLAD